MIPCGNILTEKFDKSISKIVECHRSLCSKIDWQEETIKNLTQKLDDRFANDKEISRLKQELKECKETLAHSFSIDSGEWGKIKTWQCSHNIEKHGEAVRYAGAIGGELTYEFTPTSIGIVGVVKCTCGESFTFREL